MEPAIYHGDRVLIRRTRTPRAGQVVVIEHSESADRGRPGQPAWTGKAVAVPADRNWIIKRVAAAPGDKVPRERIPALATVEETRVPPGMVVLLGDNPQASIDSRQKGYFRAEYMLGTVMRRLSHQRRGGEVATLASDQGSRPSPS